VVIGGHNYAQGSSREHAALAPRYLGQKAVIAKSYARIGWQNLVNYGIIPLEFIEDKDYDDLEENDELVIENLRESLKNKKSIMVRNKTKDTSFSVQHSMSDRQIEVILSGGMIPHFRKEQEQTA
jgi:aconitate hydratase